MEKPHDEWFKQAEYDLDTADYMVGGGRGFYAIFMCHLGIEKALKGLYRAKRGEVPPKSHDLISLLSKTGVEVPEETGKLIVQLNQAAVLTRYPDDLDAVRAAYPKEVVGETVTRVREVLAWIKQQL